MFLLLFPAELASGLVAGSGGDKEPSGERVLRLIQIRLRCAFYAQSRRITSSRAVPSLHVGCRLISTNCRFIAIVYGKRVRWSSLGRRLTDLAQNKNFNSLYERQA